MQKEERVYHIAVVDDEEVLRDTLYRSLRAEGYQVSCYADGEAALTALKRSPPDLIVLDILMPKMGGLTFCRRWRTKNRNNAILFLSSCQTEEIKLEGLLSGGDDYITKPFSMEELLVRITVALRRIEPQASLEADGLILREESWQAWLNGTAISFTVSEFRILSHLLSQPGRVFSREQLLTAAYPEDAYISDRNADAHIRRIRNKLKAIDPQFSSLESVYGVGYRYSTC